MRQADKLKAIAELYDQNRSTRIVSVTSGKGGVGKTSISLNLAYSLAQRGLKVLLVDADLGLANLNVHLNLKPTKTIDDVMFGNSEMFEIFIPTAYGFDLLPSSSGVKSIIELNSFEQRSLMDHLLGVIENYDFVVIDTAPGLSDHVLNFNTIANEILVVAHADPMAMTDAVALINVLNREKKIHNFKLILNRVLNADDKDYYYNLLSKDNVNNVSVELLGLLPDDFNVIRSSRVQKPVLALSPLCPFGVGLNEIVDQVLLSKNEKKSAYGTELQV